MKTCSFIITLALGLAACASSDTSIDTTSLSSATSDSLALTSPEFMNAEEMPANASCDGAGMSLHAA